MEKVACSSPNVIPLWRESAAEWMCPVMNFGNATETLELGLPAERRGNGEIVFSALLGSGTVESIPRPENHHDPWARCSRGPVLRANAKNHGHLLSPVQQRS